MSRKLAKPQQLVLESSTERSIAEVQLERLREIAMNRLMTPEETKQYDILVKNLLLIRGQPTVINGTGTSVEELSVEELVAIATIPDNVLNIVETSEDDGQKDPE